MNIPFKDTSKAPVANSCCSMALQAKNVISTDDSCTWTQVHTHAHTHTRPRERRENKNTRQPGQHAEAKLQVKTKSGASECILVWYGQPSEVQFTRGGGMAEPKILEIWSPNQGILLIHGVLGANSGTVNTVVTVPCATPLKVHAQ